LLDKLSECDVGKLYGDSGHSLKINLNGYVEATPNEQGTSRRIQNYPDYYSW